MSAVKVLVLAVFLPTVLWAQSHYLPVSSTGRQYHVVLSSITLDGKPARAGVEVGLFDSTTCVGAALLSFDGQTNVDVVTWQGDASYGLAGFRSGKPIVAKVWANVYGAMKELQAQIQFTSGSGNYGDGSYSVASLTCTTGVAPLLRTTPAAIDFGSVMTGISSTQSVTIKNTGNARLTVQPMSTGNPAFTLPINYSRVINPGDSIKVDVVFMPLSATPYTTTLSISSDDPVTPTVTVPLAGQGFPQLTSQLTYAPLSCDFGDVRVGETVERSIQLYNPGSKDLRIYNIISTTSLMVPSPTVLTIPPGEYRTIKVSYSAANASAINGTLTIYSDAANGSAAAIPLSARPYSSYFAPVPPIGLPYTILVSGITVDNHGLSVGDEIGIFDDTLCVGSGVYQGAYPISITAWKASSDPVMKGYTEGDSIRVKAWASTYSRKALVGMQLTWSRGNKTFGFGDYSVLNASGNSYVDPKIELSRAALTLPPTEIGLNGVDTFVVRNTGLSLLTVSGIVSSNSSFVVSAGSFFLSPGTSRIITVTYAPSSATPAEGTVTITSNDPNSPVKTISVAGQGLTASTRVLTIGASSMRFDATVKGTSSTKSISLFNAGSSTIRVTSVGFATALFSTTRYVFDIPAGTTFSLPVQFAPTAVGAFNDSIRLINTSQNIPIATIKLSGMGYEGFFQSVPQTGKGYTIVLDTVKGFTGLLPQANDEVGIFDGSMCVGTAIVGSASAGSKVTGTAWEEDVDRAQAGFTDGHRLAFRYFTRRGGQARVYDMKYLMVEGNGTFGDQPMSVVQLTIDTTRILPVRRALIPDMTIAGDGSQFATAGSLNRYFSHPYDKLRMSVQSTDTNQVIASLVADSILTARSKSNTPCHIAVVVTASDKYFSTSDTLIVNVLPPTWAFSPDTGTMEVVTIPTAALTKIGARGMKAGDAVGAFYRTSEGLACAGFVGWSDTLDLQLAVWGNNPATPSKDGMDPGEPIIFQIWDGQAQRAYLAGVSMQAGNESFSTGRAISLPVLGALPTIPVPIAPVNGYSSASAAVTLKWSTSLLASGYRLQIAKDTAFSMIACDSTLALDTTAVFISTLGRQQYYWRVQAKNAVGNNDWSSVGEFKVAVPPVLTLSSAAIQFPDRAVGDSALQVVYLKSASLGPLTITGISTNAGEYRTALALPVTVNGYDSVALPVTFLPHKFGKATDTLKIASDGGDMAIVLAGVSPFPICVPNPASLSYGSVARNASRVLEVKITNASINALSIDSLYTKTSAFVADKSRGLIGSDTLAVNVSFTPTAAGAFVDTLYLKNNSLMPLIKIPLSGSTPSPVLSIAISGLSFPDKVVNDSLALSVYIKDASISALTIASVKTTTTAFTATAASTIVAGGDSTLLTVNFKPTRFGAFTDTVTVASDGGILKIALSGTSPFPSLSSSSSSIAFGEIAKGVMKSDTLRLVNGSINALRVDSIYTKTGAYTVDLIKGTVSSDTLKLVVSFAPASFSVFDDTLYLKNNSFASLVKIPLSGNCPAPQLSIPESSVVIGPVALTDTGVGRIVIHNEGKVNTLTISQLKVVHSLFTVDTIAPLSIPPNDSITVSVRITINQLTPDGYGTWRDSLRIVSDGGAVTVALKALSPRPVIGVVPGSIAFGVVRKDSVRELSFKILNSSINQLRIDSLWTTTRYFSVLGKLASNTVKQGDTLSVVMRFVPDSARVFNDTLFIASNASVALFKVPLTGNGTLTSIRQSDGEIPSIYTLAQNYPNPFNPSTTIRYGLPSKSMVRLVIYNMLGQVVKELVNAEQAAGYQSIVWNADVASGVYLYRLDAVSVNDRSKRFVDTKKVLLLR